MFDLTSRGRTHYPTPAGEKEPTAEGVGSDHAPDTTEAGTLSTDHELESETPMGTRASVEVAPAAKD